MPSSKAKITGAKRSINGLVLLMKFFMTIGLMNQRKN